jgi:hypothetical protein
LSCCLAASAMVSADTAIPFSLSSRANIAFLENALNPDSESESLFRERTLVECRRTFCPKRRYKGMLLFCCSLEPTTKSNPSQMGLIK